jgi:hypothetical protein
VAFVLNAFFLITNVCFVQKSQDSKISLVEVHVINIIVKKNRALLGGRVCTLLPDLLNLVCPF